VKRYLCLSFLSFCSPSLIKTIGGDADDDRGMR
jgi:hypothetical protein